MLVMIEYIGNLSREMETIINVPNGNSETENLSEIKNSLGKLNCKLEMTEEGIS